MSNMIKDITTFQDEHPEYHEFLVSKSGRLVRLRGAHTTTVLELLKFENRDRYDELMLHWDEYMADGRAVYQVALTELGMIAFHNLYMVEGIPNMTQRTFIKHYRECYAARYDV